MEHRSLGKTGMAVSAIGLGCAGMSEGYGTPSDERSLQVMTNALACGINFFDTSDAYGVNGHNERLLGNFLKNSRERVTVATKVGLVRSPGKPPSISNSPDHIRAECEASLQRLGIGTIDLYYLQRRDGQVPIEEVMGAMADLVKAGKVRWIGLSEVSSETLRKAHAVHPITAVQSEYSLCTRNVEWKMLEACRELEVSFVAYCPLARGFLTGAVKDRKGLEPTDFRQRLPRFEDEALAKNLQLLPAFEQFAAKRGVMALQIALAWLLRKHPHVIPIPGTKNPNHVAQSAAAVNVELTAQDIAELDAMFPPSAVVGDRYPPPAMMGIESD